MAQTIPISADTNNRFTNSYFSAQNLEAGSLSVTIYPNEVASATDVALRGQWHRQGDSPTDWLNSGDVIDNLSPGTYAVEFKTVSGRLTPASQIIEVGPNATYSVGATYLFDSCKPSTFPFHRPWTSATRAA